MLYTDQFDSKHDFDFEGEIKQFYVILYTPRSGSHLIGHEMYRSGQFGYPLEYFNPGNVAQWKKRFNTQDAFDTFTQIKKYRTGTNGYFGCKLNYRNIQAITREKDLFSLFPDCKYIFIRRKDLLGQSISLARAWATGSFISSVQSDIVPEYDASEIIRAMELIARENASIEILTARRAMQRLDIYYEEFVSDPDCEMNRIADFLGVDLKVSEEKSDVKIPEKQRSQLNQDWRERFLQDVKDSGFDYEQALFDCRFSDLIRKFKNKVL